MTPEMQLTQAGTAVPIERPLRAPFPLATAAMHATMILLSFLAVFPVCWMVISSLKAENEIFSTRLWPATPSLENYAFVLAQIPMLRMLANTTLVSAATALLQVLTGLLAAYALTQWRFRLSGFVHGLIALSWLVPFQVTMIPNYVLASRLGLLDTLTGLVVPHAAAAFAVLMLYHAMRSFPVEVIEAARMDGA
ncbi:carbohydrate ABC transporter permease, partial [Rhizobiaceae sp. 2RAB30]